MSLILPQTLSNLLRLTAETCPLIPAARNREFKSESPPLRFLGYSPALQIVKANMTGLYLPLRPEAEVMLLICAAALFKPRARLAPAPEFIRPFPVRRK